jgi:hypothetical protein
MEINTTGNDDQHQSRFFYGRIMAIYGQREKTAKRGYDGKWQQARLAYLAEHPLCAACQARGIVRYACVVDHILPHRGDKVLFWDRRNWQALCKGCHDGDKQRLERSGRIRGCDASGLPADPRHHWRGG